MFRTRHVATNENFHVSTRGLPCYSEKNVINKETRHTCSEIVMLQQEKLPMLSREVIIHAFSNCHGMSCYTRDCLLGGMDSTGLRFARQIGRTIEQSLKKMLPRNIRSISFRQIICTR